MSTQISLRLKNPSFTLQKQDCPASYTLQFKQNDEFCDSDVKIEFSPADLEALLNQGRVLGLSSQTALTGPQEYSAWCETAWPLHRLSGREWQFLMREVSIDALLYTLWFLQDLHLARKVIGNVSKRYAASFTEEMVLRFRGKNPEDAANSPVNTAHECLREILEKLHQLQDLGIIEKSC